jgi:hypothetical protein
MGGIKGFDKEMGRHICGPDPKNLASSLELLRCMLAPTKCGDKSTASPDDLG